MAHFHAQAFTACHRSVFYIGGTAEWKMLGNDGHVSGKGGAGYPSTSCFDQLHCLFNEYLCIPQCPHLEGNTHFLYLRSLEYVSPLPPAPALIKDDRILEPVIIKRHNRNTHFASVGHGQWYMIPSQVSSVTVICVQFCNLHRIWRLSLYLWLQLLSAVTTGYYRLYLLVLSQTNYAIVCFYFSRW